MDEWTEQRERKMTTREQAEIYLAKHLIEWMGKPYALFNPHDKPLDELPVIYGFNNGGLSGWYNAVLLAEDGAGLGGHLCSDEGYMPHDLGILEGSRPDRHGTFRAHYPDGYQMAFIPSNEVMTHPGLDAAVKRNQEKADKAKENAA